MAFTRDFIRKAAKDSGTEIPKEMEDALVQEHLSARNAYAEQQVKAYQDEHPAPEAPNVKDSQEYKDLQAKYDTLVQDNAAKAARGAKEKVFRERLKATGMTDARIDTIVKHSTGAIDAIELDKDGKAKDEKALDESIRTDWADFIPTTTETGASTATPPANNPNRKTYTAADIRKMSAEEINANFDAIKASLKGET